MLATPFRLYDIDDCEGFVAATIQRAGITVETSEHEELMLEGLAILCELAGKFEPHRPGYSQPGRFSGYAAQFLPRRLGDAWHRAHPEHRYVTFTEPDGSTKRRWVYDSAPVSLDGIGQTGNGRLADDGSRLTAGIDAALARCRRIGDMIPLPIPSGCAA